MMKRFFKNNFGETCVEYLKIFGNQPLRFCLIVNVSQLFPGQFVHREAVVICRSPVGEKEEAFPVRDINHVRNEVDDLSQTLAAILKFTGSPFDSIFQAAVEE